MEKVSADNPSVFLPFGIGALLLLALGFLLDLQTHFSTFGTGHTASLISSNVWIPISAILVFSMHALGLLMIFIGRLPLKWLAKGWDDAEKAYEFLALNANDRIWVIAQSNRDAVKLAHGICGIAVAVIITFLVGIFRWCYGVSQEPPFSWDYSLIALVVLAACVGSASRANLSLVLLALRTQKAKDSPALDVMESDPFGKNASRP